MLAGIQKSTEALGTGRRAAELPAFVLQHPAIWFYTRQRAEQLMRELPLDETARSAAISRGKARVMPDVVNEVTKSLL